MLGLILMIAVNVIAVVPPLLLVLYAFQCGALKDRLTLKGYLESWKSWTFLGNSIFRDSAASSAAVIIVLALIFAKLWVSVIGYSIGIILSPVGYWFGTIYRKMKGRK